MAIEGTIRVRTVKRRAGVRYQRVEVPLPLGEKAAITIDRFPNHVELVALNIVFAEGTRAVGYPPINVAKLAETADAVAQILATREELATQLAASADELERLLPEGGPWFRDMATRLITGTPESKLAEITRLITGTPESRRLTDDAKATARTRARQRVHDDDFYRGVADYRSEHGVRKTADKYNTDDRQVNRWLAQARRRGFTYKGMREG